VQPDPAHADDDDGDATPGDTTLEALQCFGLQLIEDDSRDAQEPAEPPQPDICEVWPEHWNALLLFLKCQSQRELTLGGMGGVYYAAARSVNVKQELHWLSIPKRDHADTVHKFRTIETEALRILNQQANSKG
jgi:hypothetical protein